MTRATAQCVCKKCGKSFTKRKIVNNSSEASSWEEWSKIHCTLCPDCYSKERARVWEEKEAKEIAEGKRLAIKEPELKGSDKQWAWAYSIYSKWFNSYNSTRVALVTDLENNVFQSEKAVMYKQQIEVIDSVVSWLIETHSEASWWIENRDVFERGIAHWLKVFKI